MKKKVAIEKSSSAIRKMYAGRFDEISSAVIVTIPPRGEILSVNQEAEELTGHELSELYQMDFLDLFADEYKQRIAAIFHGPQSSEQGFHKLFEHKVIIQKRSKRKIIVDMGFRLSHIDGQAIYIFTLHDITELKSQRHRIEEQHMLLVQASKMSALGVMASGIAHEINNPLHVIKGRCELLTIDEDTVKDPVLVAEGLQVIEAMAQRIEEIVKGLKTFSRDHRQAPKEPLALKLILAETLLLCEKRIRQGGVSLSLPVVDADLGVLCRSTQVSQIILNLLNNAYDAAIAAEEKKSITVTLCLNGSFLELRIANSGPKISRQTAENIFDPFFTTKAVGQGTGLGLSISKSLVEDHGGEIFIDWQSQQTTFVMRLPKIDSLATYKKTRNPLPSAS